MRITLIAFFFLLPFLSFSQSDTNVKKNTTKPDSGKDSVNRNQFHTNKPHFEKDSAKLFKGNKPHFEKDSLKDFKGNKPHFEKDSLNGKK